MYAEPSLNANLLMMLQTVGVPLIASLLGCLFWWFNRQRISQPLFIVLPAAALGFWISFCWIQGRFAFPPQQAMDVLLPLLVVAVVLELLLPRLSLTRSSTLSILLVIFMGFVTWMLYPILSRASVVDNSILLAAIAVFYLALQFGYDRAANNQVQNALGLFLAAAAAPVFALDGTLKLAQISGALATGLGVIWLIGLLSKSDVLNVRLLTPMMVAALYVAAYQYADVNLSALLLISLGALLVVSLRRWWPIASRWLDNVRVLALSALPFALAIWLIWPEESLY